MKILKISLSAASCLMVSTGLTFVSGISETKMPAAVDMVDSLKYDPYSGLVVDTNLAFVLANCSSCHSTELIRNNRFTRDGWLAKIRWMQKEQNLWDLGESEKIILDYLEKYYSPSTMGARARLRREPLTDIHWYQL
jgi:hypothetical protein